MHKRSATYLPTVAAAITVVLWASAFVVIRGVGPTFSPGVLAFLRMFVGVIALTVVVLISRRTGNRTGRRIRPPSDDGNPPVDRPRPWFPRGRALWLVLAYGALWFGGYTIVLNWAEQHLDAGTAALLVNIAPILVAIAAGVILGEGFSRSLTIGILISFTGVVLITVGGSGAHADRLGIALGVLAAVLYAAGVLLQKVALRTVDAVTATWLGAIAGLITTLPFAPAALGELADASSSAIIGAIFLGVGPTALAFTTWAYALARTDAGAMAATTLVVPAIVIVMSYVFLYEVPTPLRIVGGVLCLAGVAVGRRLLPVRRRVHGHATTDTHSTDAHPTETPATQRSGRFPTIRA